MITVKNFDAFTDHLVSDHSVIYNGHCVIHAVNAFIKGLKSYNYMYPLHVHAHIASNVFGVCINALFVTVPDAMIKYMYVSALPTAFIARCF